MPKTLSGGRVAILVTDGFEQVEMTEPKTALEDAGARVDIVSPKTGRVKGWCFDRWGGEFPVDTPLEKADPGAYDALVLPGGVMNPDHLRVDGKAVAFVRAFFDAGKPVAAICHGPWTMIEAGVVRGRKMTSFPSIRSDLQNAGADWVDRQVVAENGLVTSRKPDDIPAFNRSMIDMFAGAMASAHAAD